MKNVSTYTCSLIQSAAILFFLALPARSWSFSLQEAASQPEQSQDAQMTITAAAPVIPPSVVGEIQDPVTGALWLMLRNNEHPAGPNRLVLAAGVKGAANTIAEKPVIHAGDHIVIEKHSQVVDAQLEAIALTNAARGHTLRARIVLGGGVVMVQAVDTARAEFTTEAEQ